MKNLEKFWWWGVSVLAIIHIFTPIMYSCSCMLINMCDKTIIERYATDDKFESCVFLNGEEVVSSNIIKQLTDEIDELKTVKSKQDLGRIIFEHKDTVKKMGSKN